MGLFFKLGIHRWEMSRPLSTLDIFPPAFLPHEAPMRRCKICGKQQRWLPGYGGSEPGCWIDVGPKSDLREWKAPFDTGDLIQVEIEGLPVITEFRQMDDEDLIVRWGTRGQRSIARIPWWRAYYLSRKHPGRCWESDVAWVVWLWYWLRYLPYRIVRDSKRWKEIGRRKR